MSDPRARLAWLLSLVLSVGVSSSAFAQTTAPSAAPPTAPPTTPIAPAPEAAPKVPEAAQPTAPPSAVAPAEELPAPPPAECFPACREGHVCHDGTCISACNPPCRADERCTAEAQCEPAQAPPPPTYAGVQSEADVPPPPLPVEHGVHTHDGFMLRFTVGFGGGGMHEEYEGTLLGVETSGDADYTGGGVTLALDLGGALSPSFSLHGRLAMFQLVEPELDVAGTQGTLEDTYVVSGLLGIGATYTLMPLNLYFTGVIGPAVNSLSYRPDGDPDEDRSDSSDAGFGLNLDIGKEWWVSRQTGIGIAARFWLATTRFENDFRESTLTFAAGAIMFSLTYQ